MSVVESCLLFLMLTKLNRVKKSLCNNLRWSRVIERMLLTEIMKRVAKKEKRMF